LIQARKDRGWSQAELGRRVGLPQAHISGIESGKVVPRFDTLLDIVRTLSYDLLLVPRDLVPVVQSLSRTPMRNEDDADGPLYQPDEGGEDS
jgi:transcriptional regulator with XRE-family HTH domain